MLSTAVLGPRVAAPSAALNCTALPRGAGLLLPADGGSRRSLSLNSCYWLDFTTLRRRTARTARPSIVSSSMGLRTQGPRRQAGPRLSQSGVDVQAPPTPTHTGRPHPHSRLRPHSLTQAGNAHTGRPRPHNRLRPRPPLPGAASDAAFHAALYVLGSGFGC